MPAPHYWTPANLEAAPAPPPEQAPVLSSRRHGTVAPLPQLPPQPHGGDDSDDIHHVGVTHVLSSSFAQPSITIHHADSDEIEVSAVLVAPEQAPTGVEMSEWRTETGPLEKLATFLFLQGSVCFLATWGLVEARGLDNHDNENSNNNLPQVMVVLAYISFACFALLQLLVDVTLDSGDRHFAHTLYGTLGRPLNVWQSLLFVSGAILQAIGWHELLQAQARQYDPQINSMFDNDPVIDGETQALSLSISSAFAATRLELQQSYNSDMERNDSILQKASNLNLFGCVLWDLNMVMVLFVFRSGRCCCGGCSPHGKRYGWGNVLFGLACIALTTTACLVWMEYHHHHDDEDDDDTDSNNDNVAVARWIASGLLLATSLVYVALDEVSSCFDHDHDDEEG